MYRINKAIEQHELGKVMPWNSTPHHLIFTSRDRKGTAAITVIPFLDFFRTGGSLDPQMPYFFLFRAWIIMPSIPKTAS